MQPEAVVQPAVDDTVAEITQAWPLTLSDDAERLRQSRVAGVGPPVRNDCDGVGEDVANRKAANSHAQQSRELTNELLEHADALVKDHEALETGEDIANALQRSLTLQPLLLGKARDLHEKLMDAEAPRVSVESIRDARRNLYQILKRLCRGRDIPNLRQKMHTYAYVQAARGMKLLNQGGALPLLSEEMQAALLDGALGFAPADEGDDCVWEGIRDTQVKPCLSQVVKKTS